MLTVIDCDSIVFKAGFAVEKVTYEVVAEDKGGSLQVGRFDDKQCAGEWIYEIGADPEFAAIEVIRDVEPIENALQIVKTMLTEIECATGCDDPLVCLSGKDNYRFKIAKTRPYKGNRDPSHRPRWEAKIREYLIKQHGAFVSEGCEADDVVSIAGRSRECVIAGIDKDLDQIPGRHYDYSKKVHYTVSDEDAERAFWMQALTGDASDNVGGVYRMGPKKAAPYLALGAERGFEPWDVVRMAYAESQELRGCPYADKDAYDVALENTQLVYLQRQPGELWLPNEERGKTSDIV